MKTKPDQPNRLDESSRRQQGRFRAVVKEDEFPSPRAYNLTISDSHRFLWFRVAKVGTRTLIHHLRSSGVRLDLDHASNAHYPINRYRDYFKFAFVRDPWDRLVSCWFDKVAKENAFKLEPEAYRRVRGSFPAFVDYVEGLDLDGCDRHLKRQTSLIDLNHVDFVGRLESYDRDLRAVLSRVGVPADDVVPRNVSPARKPYPHYYTDALAERVGRLYQRDAQVLGYRYGSSEG